MARRSAVSIHARHCWRATPTFGAPLVLVNSKFQSTPAIAGGRLIQKNSLGWPARRFNPRPPLLAGDSMIPRIIKVSQIEFQSTPAIAGGRLGHHVGVGAQRCGVSIHARHCWRATRCANSLQTTPAKFQSTPAIAGGRLCQRLPHCRQCQSFNPRPPLLAGDSTLCTEHPPGQGLFQSTPAIAGGRLQHHGLHQHSHRWFQSTPAIAGGRLAKTLLACHADVIVSIHARHCWRATPLE